MFNLLHLVISPPDNSLLYRGVYNPLLVILSISVAIFASYASLLVSQYVSTITKAKVRRLWTVGGGLCLGLGVWAMHFVGMLAFSLPCTSNYDPAITFLSMIPSILASILAIKIISRNDLSLKQLATGGLLIGLGIGAMHYSGMAAMRLNGMIRYDVKLFSLSILVAIALATLALWIKFRLMSWKPDWHRRITIVSAIVMGLAVSGMHYTAMAAAYFINNGETTDFTTGISPGYLAANVLIATCLIIVFTLVATYFNKHSEFSITRSYKLIGSLIIGWILFSWYGADYFFNHLGEDLLNQESVRATEKLNNITGNINGSLELLKGSAQVISREPETIRILHRLGPNTVPSTLEYDKRKQVWTKDKVLAGLSNSLDYATPRLGAELIFIVNAAGDCVASSNIGEAESLVGSNFADRLYFKQARAGKEGRQYAVGRATNIPGLFFSSPVFESGHFIGAVVVKRNVNKLANWTRQENVYIADANGVIVMAPEKQFEFRYMPGSPAANLSSKNKLLLYKRNDLEPLKLTPWGSLPSVVLIDNKFPPVLFKSKILDENAITIYVHAPLYELERFGAERYWLFLLLATAGNLFIVAVSAIFIYIRESQKLNAELRITASAFESDEGIIVTNANNEILRVNRTFTAITGYSAEEVAGKSPRMFKSEKHSAEFFSSMWDSIANTGTWEGEIWNRRKNGEEYPEYLIITAVKNNDGKVTNYVATFSDITERIKSETALNEAHQKMFSLLNSMAEGAYGVDINGNCTFVNRAFLRILGYEHAEEIIGRHMHELIHHSHIDGSPYPSTECKMYKAFRQNQEIHVSDEVFWNKNGLAIQVEYWSQPIIIGNEVQGAIATFIDVTERRLSEELLRKSTDEIEDLYNHAPCGYHSLDKEGVVRRINETELQWLGYTREEVVGKIKMSDLLAPASRQAFQKNFAQFKKHGFIRDYEVEMMRKDGSTLHGLVNSTVIVNAANEFISSRATVFDITERKKTEDTLRSLFAALEHSPIAVIITDSNTNIMYASPRFTRISGYPANEIRGSNLRILQAGNIEKNTYLAMWDALTNGKSWHGEMLNKTKQGRAYWEEVQISPVKTPGGDISNYVVVSTDISERKSVEEKMRHLATYDPLTDLPNRSLVNDRIRQALNAAKRDNMTRMALMFLDLDNFKPINDTLGHNVGDLLLIEASKRMQDCVRESDTVGRIGGDEFVVLLPTVDSGQDAMLVAEKIRYALNQPFVLAGNNLQISSSIGLAIYPEHGEDDETLVKNADIAMYHAKQVGRNNVQLFRPEMQEGAM